METCGACEFGEQHYLQNMIFSILISQMEIFLGSYWLIKMQRTTSSLI